MEAGERPRTEGFRRLEAALALIERGVEPRDACATAGWSPPLYGDELRRVMDTAIRLHDEPASLTAELVDVYTLRFGLAALDWTPLAVAPGGDWHIVDPDDEFLATIRAVDPTGRPWEFVIDTSELYEQIVRARRLDS